VSLASTSIAKQIKLKRAHYWQTQGAHTVADELEGYHYPARREPVTQCCGARVVSLNSEQESQTVPRSATDNGCSTGSPGRHMLHRNAREWRLDMAMHCRDGHRDTPHMRLLSRTLPLASPEQPCTKRDPDPAIPYRKLSGTSAYLRIHRVIPSESFLTTLRAPPATHGNPSVSIHSRTNKPVFRPCKITPQSR
jgi:hypothetical protein